MSKIETEAQKISTNDKLTLVQAKKLLRTLMKQESLSESYIEVAYPYLDPPPQAKL